VPSGDARLGAGGAGLRREALYVSQLVLVKAVRVPLWLLVSAMLTHVFDPSGLGQWSMILSAAAFLNQLLLHWTQSITQRFGRGEWSATRRLDAVWALRWPSLVLGLGVIVCSLALLPFDWTQRFYGLDHSHRWYVLPVAITLWIMAEVQSAQQVSQRFSALAWAPIVADLGLLLCIGLLAYVAPFGRKPGFDAVVAPIVGTSLIIWCCWLARELSITRIAWHLPELDRWRQAARFAIPLVPGFLVGYLSEWCDYFLIQRFYGSQAVGLFHPAFQYMLILIGLPTAVVSVLLPRFTTDFDKNGRLEVEKLIGRTAPQLFVLWGLLSLVAAATLPSLLLLLLGKQFDATSGLLQVLLIAVPGAMSQHICYVACFVQRRLWTATVGLFGLKLLVNVAVSLVLLPRIGVVGSALGTGLSYIALQWAFLIDQRRHLEAPKSSIVIALLLIQGGGVALALTPGIWLRLALCGVWCAGLIAWARRDRIFPAETVAAVIPDRLAALTGPAVRLLCRCE
jgi:O-antigen/teichoic acid export membrane protein